MINCTIWRRPSFRWFLSGLLLLQVMLPASWAVAQEGGVVAAGAATITQDAGNLNVVTQSDRTVINWQGFNVDAGKSANFLQPNASSTVLNRVVTQNNPSLIYGNLNSNGNVILVNPSGIVVGPSGVINTNGFTASVLDIPDLEFLQGGPLHFRGDSTASVINQGRIQTGAGGAALIGGDVINEGTITSQGGSISLATGGSVVLGDGSRFTHADLSTIEMGLSPYAGVIQNSGTIRATGAVEAGGEVFLVNPGGKIMHDGTIAATINRADGTVDGGAIAIDASEGGTVELGGETLAQGNRGGEITVEGQQVELKNALLDSSGDIAGGSVLVGGGYQGADPLIENALTTRVDASSLIRADALVNGDGGQVVIWSDESTTFEGEASARGGILGGDGGLIEVSGRSLAFTGSANTTAPNGRNGWLLLDPKAIVVTADDVTGGIEADPTADPVLLINDEALSDLLTGGNVLLATSDSASELYSDGFTVGVDGGDDSILLEDGTEILTDGNILFLSTTTLTLGSTVDGMVLGGDDYFGPEEVEVKSPNTVNVLNGMFTRGSVQQAIQVVEDGGLISLGEGTFDSFVVDREGLTIAGQGATSIVQAASPAITITADDTILQNMQLIGTGAAGETGVLLDGNAAPGLTGIEIIGVDFSRLEDGIRSRGDIGDLDVSSIDLVIRGNSAADPTVFEDMSRSAIRLRDSNGNVGIDIQDVVVRDGMTDADLLGTGGDGFDLGDVGDVSIQGVVLNGIGRDGIRFGRMEFGDVFIDDTIIGQLTQRVGRHGINFTEGIQGLSTVTLNDGVEVYATNRGIRTSLLTSPQSLQLIGGTYNATGGAVLIDNRGFPGITGRLLIDDSDLVAGPGSDVIRVRTDAGNAGVRIEIVGSPTITGGANGLRLEGPGIDIADDSLGSLAFSGQTGDYIRLQDGAEFAPGTPTVIDATDVTFEGLRGIEMTPEQLFATEDKMVHFPDDPTLGLIDISPLFVVQGESIQRAVNVASTFPAPQTVVVGSGIFGGSVEVYVNDLTLVGTGNDTIIDTTAVDPFANNGDRDNGFEVVRRSIFASRLGPVQRVTIDGFRFDDSATTGQNIGIQVGRPIFSAAEDLTVLNSDFRNLENGIVVTNMAGDLVLNNLDMNLIADKGLFVDDILTGADSLTLTNSSIRTIGESVEFNRAIIQSEILIQGNRLRSFDDDALQFEAPIVQSEIQIGGGLPSESNRIRGLENGIDVESLITGSSFNVVGNELIRGDEGIGVFVEGDITGSQVAFGNNQRIRGGENGMLLEGSINGSLLAIGGNERIQGDSNDGIGIEGDINFSAVTIGSSIVPSPSGIQFFGGNGAIVGDEDGINVNGIDTSLFLVDDNDRIFGRSGSGIEFDGELMQALAIISRNDVVRGGGYGIEFDAPVDSSLVAISANRRIRGGGDNAIGFREDVTGSGILIGGPLAALGNEQIISEGSAIRFEGAIAEGTQVQIANNARIDGIDSDSDGIQFSGEIRDQGTFVQIVDNPNVAGGSRGVVFQESIDSASVAIQRNTITADSIDAILFNNDVINGSVLIGGGVADGNRLIGADEGIDLERIDGGTFEVLNNQIEAGRRGIEFENDIVADARVTIGQNQIEAGQVGIFQNSSSEILDSAIVEFLDNEIEVFAADGFAYQLNNFGSSNPVLIQGGMVSGGGTGVEVSQVAGNGLVGSLIIDGLLIKDPSSVGIRIANTNAADRLEVALINGVTIQGGASPGDVGLIFDGLGLSLTGNTLADTRFEGQNGNFIELKNGALFEPGRPTLIDGTGVFWDGLDPTTRDGYLAVINRIVDFLDDPTLGLIFPGAPEIGPGATYDRFTRYEDFFRTVGSLLGPNRGVARFRAATVDVAESLEEQASPE